MSAGNLSGEHAALCVPYEGSGGLCSDADASLAFCVLIDVDVQLLAILDEGHTEAAFDLFDGHINALRGVGGGGQVVAVHLAGEEQGLTALCLDQVEQTGGAGCGLALNSGDLIGNGAEACGELGHADLSYVLASDVLDIGSGDGVVGAVGAQVTVCASNLSGVNLALFVPHEGSGGLCSDADTSLAFCVLIDVDVHLGLAFHEEEANAALNLFDGHINSLGGISGGSQVVAVHATHEVQGLTTLGLDQSILIGLANLGNFHEGRTVGSNGSAGDIELEGGGSGLALSVLNGCGQGVLYFLFGLLIDVDGNLGVTGYDLNQVLGYVGGPLDLVGNATDVYNADQVEVTQGLAGQVLVHGEQIRLCVCQSIHCGSLRCFFAASQCAQAQHDCKDQSNQFFHVELLVKC